MSILDESKSRSSNKSDNSSSRKISTWEGSESRSRPGYIYKPTRGLLNTHWIFIKEAMEAHNQGNFDILSKFRGILSFFYKFVETVSTLVGNEMIGGGFQREDAYMIDILSCRTREPLGSRAGMMVWVIL